MREGELGCCGKIMVISWCRMWYEKRKGRGRGRTGRDVVSRLAQQLALRSSVVMKEIQGKPYQMSNSDRSLMT